MSYEPCRYLRYKELFSLELVPPDKESSPTVSHAWCNLTLKGVGRDDPPSLHGQLFSPGARLLSANSGSAFPVAVHHL